jgi:sialate O-acetylesterase
LTKFAAFVALRGIMKQFLSRMLACLCLVALTPVSRADFQLPALFSDNVILQRDVSVPVWGWADDGEVITVRFRGQKVSATTQNGKWSLRLRKLKAGGPDVLTVSSAARKVELKNVMVGEVWIASGQSNMEWPITQSDQPEATAASATNSQLRFFMVPNVKSEAPTVRVNASWKVCAADMIGGYSAVAYHFARDLQAALKVPVGIIQSDWGGSPAEVWMNRESLEINPRYRSEILEANAEAWKNYQQSLVEFEKEKALAASKGEEFKKQPPRFGWRPTELYNGMIAPLIPYAIKGAIWYQGESNAGRAEQYRTLFPDMIRNWRRDWGQGDFTFLAVQLAPFMKVQDQPQESNWAELREAQALATRTLPNVGMVVITDVGDPVDIHPRKKQPVGARLALAARGIAYGEKIEYSGPRYQSLRIEGNQAVVSFDHVGKGLEAREGALKGFAICGEDRKFVWARAEIAGNAVVVSSPEVPQPVAVRYGWADCPVVNLWNKDGLPASPFRTDEFPMITAGKK